MQLYAALLPPRPVLEDLAAVVRSVRGSAAELAAVQPEIMHLPLGNFGNVGMAERLDLKAALQEDLRRRPPMRLRFRGGAALVEDGDDSVWALIDGDVEQLVLMGNAIPHVVHPLGFLIDRRLFQTRMRVGRISSATTAHFLERLLVRLDGYCGPAWTAHDIVLVRQRFGAREIDPAQDVLHEVPLLGDCA